MASRASVSVDWKAPTSSCGSSRMKPTVSATTTGVPPGNAMRRTAIRLFWVQFALNLLWSPLFFGLHSPGAAFIDICLLWMAVVATALAFGRLRPLAGYLLLPYVLWVSFALVLNGTIWLMNA